MASSVVLLLRAGGRQAVRSTFGRVKVDNVSRVQFSNFALRPATFQNGNILAMVAASSPQQRLPALCRGMGKDAKRASAREVSDSDSDSDSDSGKDSKKRKEKGTSEFWRLKMRTLHALLDINKDGVVSWDDFQIIGDRFIKLGHLSPAQQQDFRDTLKSVWEEQWGPADPYNMVNAYQYLDNMLHVLNDKNLKRKQHRFLPFLFQAVDKDKSGEISVEEYKLFFKCLGLSDEEAVASFRSIDINHDNRLSQKEFVKYGRQFFQTEDERKPSRNFWGPLLAN